MRTTLVRLSGKMPAAFKQGIFHNNEVIMPAIERMEGETEAQFQQRMFFSELARISGKSVEEEREAWNRFIRGVRNSPEFKENATYSGEEAK